VTFQIFLGLALQVLSAAIIIALMAAHGPWPWLRRNHPWVAGAAFMGLTVWTVCVAPDANIDVQVFHNEALKALNAGHSPYDNTIPNIYPTDKTYGPGMVVNGRVSYGYVYPPLNLLLAWPGYLLGDTRYALGAAVVIGVICVLRLAPSWLGCMAMALLLLTPRSLYVIDMTWIEPFMFMLLGLTLLSAQRAPRFLPVTLGLLAVCKQYAPFLLPTMFLLPALRHGWRAGLDTAWRAAAVGVAVTLPFVLWSPAMFYRGAIYSHLLIGLRHDALNYVAWWGNSNGNGFVPDLFWGYVLALLAAAWALARAPCTLAGAAMATGWVFLILISFSSQAFCNYYWLIIACFFTAAAATVGACPRLNKRAW
jgi:hypothetical protein